MARRPVKRRRIRWYIGSKIAAFCSDKVDGQACLNTPSRETWTCVDQTSPQTRHTSTNLLTDDLSLASLLTLKTLHTFLTKANAGLREDPIEVVMYLDPLNPSVGQSEPLEVVLFAKPNSDTSIILRQDSPIEAFDRVQPLAPNRKALSGYEAIDDFLRRAGREREDINSDRNCRITGCIANIRLDEPAASRDGVCFVFVDYCGEEANSADVGFRCAFDDVPAAVTELQHLQTSWSDTERARRMRNEAAMCGGVWRAETMARIRAQEAANPSVLRCHLEPSIFPPFKGKRKLLLGSRRTLVPLFITAGNLTLATLNDFLIGAVSYGREHKREEPESEDRLCVVTNVGQDSDLDSDYRCTSGPAEHPLEALPALPKELLHASPEACMAFARSRFPADADQLELSMFVIIDELTEAHKTVIVAHRDRSRGLVLLRCPFDFTIDLIPITENTVQTYDRNADDASRNASGVAKSWAERRTRHPPPS